MSGRSQHHNRYAIDDISEPCCCYTSRIKHHEPQHTPAARTRHAFELIEHSKALMARETEAASETPRRRPPPGSTRTTPVEPQGKSKSTIERTQPKSYQTASAAPSLLQGA
ncbi:hypothetical protein Bca52824_027891 [Brassica carinata]|uniref:Uncharacterized protein n=1 Tax=Brassica carinata TaxID=52824 RepID=A0A8X7VBC5_BRACI|nr:hypothetical protein Bca52824_027891 [Brassica carinata]